MGAWGHLPRCHRPQHWDKTSADRTRTEGGRGQAVWGALTPTCSWILLLKYFWMSLRLVEEQRARRLSSDCREDKG